MVLGIDASRANHERKCGVEWYAWHIIENLKRVIPADVEVRLYTDAALTGDLAELPPNWKANVLAWPPRRLWTQVRLSYEMVVNPPDVLFIPAHVPPLIHPKKTVMMVHDVAALRFPEAYNSFERWYSLATARYAARHLPLVITPSEFTKQELLQFCQPTEVFGKNHRQAIKEDKIKVIRHGYYSLYRQIHDTAETWQRLERLGLIGPFLLAVGRLEKKKNTVGVIRAYEAIRKRLPGLDLRLVLIGSPGYGYEAARAAIDASQYRSDMIVISWLPTEDMIYVYNGASVLLFPSFYEGFGLPLLEAMACGTPVVASRGSSLSEVGGEAGFYVDPDKNESLVNAVVELLTNETRRADLSAAGLARARVFSWGLAAQETWTVLSDLLKRSAVL